MPPRDRLQLCPAENAVRILIRGMPTRDGRQLCPAEPEWGAPLLGASRAARWAADISGPPDLLAPTPRLALRPRPPPPRSHVRIPAGATSSRTTPTSVDPQLIRFIRRKSARGSAHDTPTLRTTVWVRTPYSADTRRDTVGVSGYPRASPRQRILYNCFTDNVLRKVNWHVGSVPSDVAYHHARRWTYKVCDAIETDSCSFRRQFLIDFTSILRYDHRTERAQPQRASIGGERPGRNSELPERMHAFNWVLPPRRSAPAARTAIGDLQLYCAMRSETLGRYARVTVTKRVHTSHFAATRCRYVFVAWCAFDDGMPASCVTALT